MTALQNLTLDIVSLQTRLAIAADGNLGPRTYATLFAYVAHRNLGERGLALGHGAVAYFAKAGITTPLRLAHFTAQACHESAGFLFLREIWGPTITQSRYEGRRDLGNVVAGDGKKFMGRGLFQLTGRANYTDAGRRLGLDLIKEPQLAERPDIAVATACDYWTSRKLNDIADADDATAMTRKINGKTNGLKERLALTERAREILL